MDKIIKENIANNGRAGFVTEWINFKEECVNQKIFSIDEIIKLFEVFITS